MADRPIDLVRRLFESPEYLSARAYIDRVASETTPGQTPQDRNAIVRLAIYLGAIESLLRHDIEP